MPWTEVVNLKTTSPVCLFLLTITLSGCVALERPPAPRQSTERPTFISMVVSVSDGDTLFAFVNGMPENIRLTGIDCPERDQPFAQEATQLTKQLALRKP